MRTAQGRVYAADVLDRIRAIATEAREMAEGTSGDDEAHRVDLLLLADVLAGCVFDVRSVVAGRHALELLRE